jgi:biopolymer transport protein TolR
MSIAVGGGHAHKAEPNVVPMIDIMLVLLIIFMIVTPIISAGFQATMPMGKNLEQRPAEQNDVVLGIDRTGRFYLDPAMLSDGTVREGEIGPVCREQGCNQNVELERRLRDIFAARTMDKILYFKADQNLSFGRVEEALTIARKAGVRVLAAVTEIQQEPGGIFGSRKREREER